MSDVYAVVTKPQGERPTKEFWPQTEFITHYPLIAMLMVSTNWLKLQHDDGEIEVTRIEEQE